MKLKTLLYIIAVVFTVLYALAHPASSEETVFPLSDHYGWGGDSISVEVDGFNSAFVVYHNHLDQRSVSAEWPVPLPVADCKVVVQVNAGEGGTERVAITCQPPYAASPEHHDVSDGGSGAFVIQLEGF